jgi:hypothetical protein
MRLHPFSSAVRARVVFLAAVAGITASLLGCEGTVTGTKALTVPLQAEANGGFAPIKIMLTPDMSPVALNFRAEQTLAPSEAGKWNRYSATLSQNGNVRAQGEFNFNYTGSGDTSQGSIELEQTQTMMMFTLAESGEFDLTIKPIKPVDVTVKNARLEARKNIQVAR